MEIFNLRLKLLITMCHMVNLDEVLPFKFDVTLCTRTYYFLTMEQKSLLVRYFLEQLKAFIAKEK